MELIIKQPIPVFDMTAINVSNVIYAKHFSWNEGQAGFVTSVTEKQITVQYHPGIGNVTNHFFIPVNEVENGDWQIRWSSDLSEVHEYHTSVDEETESKDTQEEQA